MNDAELNSLEWMLGRWLLGGPARTGAPSSWQTATEGLPETEAELRLLALAGQALQVTAHPRPDSRLFFRPDLPELHLPMLEGEARRLYLRSSENTGNKEHMAQVLRLVAARGYVVHPLDGMPPGNPDAWPDVYSPWAVWMKGEQIGPCPGERITSDNWEVFTPAERNRLLRSLRQADPSAVTDLYAARLASESLEIRVTLLAILSVKLGDYDRELLRDFSHDRSARIREIAAHFLARLGEDMPCDDPGEELAQYFVRTTTGLFRHRPLFKARSLKNDAQKKGRAERLTRASLGRIALALETTPAELAAHWQFGETPDVDLLMTQLVGQTASDELTQLWCERTLAESEAFSQLLMAVRERLSAGFRRRVAEKALATGLPLSVAGMWMEGQEGSLPLEALKKSPHWDTLSDALSAEIDKGESQKATTAEALFHFGILSDSSAAQARLDQFHSWRLSGFDIRVTLLQLNAVLSPATTTTNA